MSLILIVDKNETAAAHASEILMNAGHACGSVSSGEEALALLCWRRPDLLLLVQDLPDMTGTQLLRKLRNSPKTYDLPVIMLTNVDGKVNEAIAFYHGAQALIYTPYNIRILTNEVEKVLAARVGRPKHTSLEDYLEQATGRWREMPRLRAVG